MLPSHGWWASFPYLESRAKGIGLHPPWCLSRVSFLRAGCIPDSDWKLAKFVCPWTKTHPTTGVSTTLSLLFETLTWDSSTHHHYQFVAWKHKAQPLIKLLFFQTNITWFRTFPRKGRMRRSSPGTPLECMKLGRCSNWKNQLKAKPPASQDTNDSGSSISASFASLSSSRSRPKALETQVSRDTKHWFASINKPAAFGPWFCKNDAKKHIRFSQVEKQTLPILSLSKYHLPQKYWPPRQTDLSALLGMYVGHSPSARQPSPGPHSLPKSLLEVDQSMVVTNLLGWRWQAEEVWLAPRPFFVPKVGSFDPPGHEKSLDSSLFAHANL